MRDVDLAVVVSAVCHPALTGQGAGPGGVARGAGPGGGARDLCCFTPERCFNPLESGPIPAQSSIGASGRMPHDAENNSIASLLAYCTDCSDMLLFLFLLTNVLVVRRFG